MTDDDQKNDRLRGLAVSKHDLEAAAFESEYGTRQIAGYRASAFLLGREKIDRVLEDSLTCLPAGARILDVGCGTGHQVVDLTRSGFDAVGLEPASEMRNRARILNPEVRIEDGSITDLPFDDSSFDGVIALEVLRYLPREDNLAAYREINRVLRPGGLIFLTMVNRWAFDGYALWETVKAGRARRKGGSMRAHCEFVTPRQVCADLVGHGFCDVETIGRLILPLRWAYKVNLGLGRVAVAVLEPVDDLLARLPGITAFAGHLIVVARSDERSVH